MLPQIVLFLLVLSEPKHNCGFCGGDLRALTHMWLRVGNKKRLKSQITAFDKNDTPRISHKSGKVGRTKTNFLASWALMQTVAPKKVDLHWIPSLGALKYSSSLTRTHPPFPFFNLANSN